MDAWIQLSFSTSVVTRALKVSAIVGTILILINHGDALARGDVDVVRLLKFFLTYTVPYLVSTYASTSAILELRRQGKAAT